jgi:ADP-ribosyl-[dinitrogen reductase] hydrolase
LGVCTADRAYIVRPHFPSASFCVYLRQIRIGTVRKLPHHGSDYDAMKLQDSILGCLLGTTVADAAGLRREGLSRERALRMYGGAPLEASLVFGRAFCSDDTEQTLMVGRALVLSAGCVEKFEQSFAADLRKWLLTCPAGIGLATLRSCLKLLVGFGPRRSGVFSAGNGPAMRAALIGVWAKDDEALVNLVKASTRITHTDPRAAAGALLVARAARLARTERQPDPRQFLAEQAANGEGDELRTRLEAAVAALGRGETCQDFATSQGWSRGISGYVNQTVPTALYCWARSPHDFRECVESAVLLGGDTDTVAAIAGGVCGAHLGSDAIPRRWIEQLGEWPRTKAWTDQLAQSLADAAHGPSWVGPPPMHWLASLPRNLLFATIVLGIGFRRLLPPY